MNDYQEKILKFFGVDNFFYLYSHKENKSSNCPIIYYDRDGVKVPKAVFKYDDNRISTKYSLRSLVSPKINIYFLISNNWIKVEENYEYSYDSRIKFNYYFDINNLPKKIKIDFNGLEDDLEIDIINQLISEDDWNKRINSSEYLKEFIKPSINTGSDLINVYWNNVNEKVENTLIELYYVNHLFLSKEEVRLVMKSKVSKDILFKSITGLGFGKYRLKIIELDSKDNTITELDFIEIYLRKPDDGRNMVFVH